jgi:RecB family exonuclease
MRSALDPLPGPLEDIEVPVMFSPTALLAARTCKLKATLGSRRDGMLTAGPAAAIGQLSHRVLERGWGKKTAEVRSIFEDEYRRLVSELAADPRRRHFADLANTRPFAEWTSLQEWLERSATGGRSHGIERSQRFAKTNIHVGAEKTLRSKKLRLRGRADRVRQVGNNHYEIRDFKSGTTLDATGEVKAEIVLQMWAYGLILAEAEPTAQIRLVVDDGQEREIAFDDAARSRAFEELMALVSDLPSPGVASSSSLANAGEACWSCAHRHRCDSYLRVAPEWWKSYPREVGRVPFDVWGTLLEVEREPSSTNLRLLDVAGRRVRIAGIDFRHGEFDQLVGENVFLFSLEARGTSRSFNGERFHPRSFHELPRDRYEKRAWAVEIFLDRRFN